MGYRDILRGPQLKSDYDKYMIWLDKSTAEKQALYRTSRQGTKFTYSRAPIWISPFGQSAKILYVQAKGIADGQVAPAVTVRSLLANYFGVAAPTAAGDIILESKLFPIGKLAKLSVKNRVTTATNETASRITGREYKHHTTNAASMPFGKNVAGDDYASVVRAIKELPAYKAFLTAVGNTIQFVPED